MLRRLVFAVALIGAAFAGGALINGPGLAWLQRNFAGGPSIIVDGGSTPLPSSKATPKQFPTAKSPPLQNDLRRRSEGSRRTPQASTPVESAQTEAPLLAELPSTPASALAPLPAGPASPLTSVDPLAMPAAGPPPLERERERDPMAKSDPVARLTSAETPATRASSTSSSQSKDWGELRARMKAQGIVRYTIEGETDGRVRFSCVIPVDGLKAVGHHFEAEGDDEIQAVEATLKRITLWKATTLD